MSETIAYHTGRAEQERAIAARARSGLARDLHNQLADRHLDRVFSIEEANAEAEEAA